MKRTMHGLVALALLAGPLLAQAAFVTVGNREWRQLTETKGFSWNQVATVCDATTGVCNGSLGSVDFTGWTWASNSDIQGLFQALIKADGFPTATSNYTAPGTPGDDPAIAAFLAPGAFTPTTCVAPFGCFVSGSSRTRADDFDAYTPTVTDFRRPYSIDSDFANLSSNYPIEDTIFDGGVWLRRQSPEVPLPAAAYLLVSGLAGLLSLSRRGPGKPAAAV